MEGMLIYTVLLILLAGNSVHGQAEQTCRPDSPRDDCGRFVLSRADDGVYTYIAIYVPTSCSCVCIVFYVKLSLNNIIAS